MCITFMHELRQENTYNRPVITNYDIIGGYFKILSSTHRIDSETQPLSQRKSLSYEDLTSLSEKFLLDSN